MTSARPQDGALRVRELGISDAELARWDAFVKSMPHGTFFHLAGWKRVLERGLGHEATFLYAERGDAIEGVLPLGHVHSWLFGNALVSTPFCVYGGAIARSDAARDVLQDEACRRAEALRVDYLELRNRAETNPQWPARRDRYVTFRKALDPDPDVNFRQIPKKQRAMVRKGIAGGLTSVVDDDLERFYDAFAESVRNLGTPVFSRRYFRELKSTFGDACEIARVMSGDRVVAGVMSFYFRDEVLPYHGGGTAVARTLYANDFMYWDLMCRATERGVRVFDYGRSKVDTGSYHFKRHWGFEPESLHYEYRLVRAIAVPDLSPLNPKYRAFIAAWRRLPLPVSRLLGPVLARNLG